MLGVLLTRWTIRLALVCYAAYLAGWLITDQPRWSKISRWLWTAGCALFLVHVTCAFHFVHRWSHAAAWESTARETQELLGVSFGDGIYFSYLFGAVWLVDVAWLWLATARHSARTPWTRGLVHAYLFFIAFNGAIVFEGGPVRWAGIVVCLLLACLAVRRLYNLWRVPTTDTSAAFLTPEP
jgi:hypothetical protein